jgi:hypothetical protein
MKYDDEINLIHLKFTVSLESLIRDLISECLLPLSLINHHVQSYLIYYSVVIRRERF